MAFSQPSLTPLPTPSVWKKTILFHNFFLRNSDLSYWTRWPVFVHYFKSTKESHPNLIELVCSCSLDYCMLFHDFLCFNIFFVFFMPTKRQSFFVRYAMYIWQDKLKFKTMRRPSQRCLLLVSQTFQHLIGEEGSSHPKLVSSPG